jgi:hypothetical protein
MKRLLPYILLFITLNTFAQKEANFWYFGRNAGIDFNTTPPTAITNGQINTLEGCSSFADTSGNLLFYSDGITVFDKTHQIMANTDGSLANNLKGNPSSTQSGMIIPKPGSSSIYYLFTVGDNQNPAFDLYTIDMSLNGGNGQLIDEDGDGDFSVDLAQLAQDNSLGTANQINKGNWTEKVAAVRGKDCNTFWVVSKVFNVFYSYKIDVVGVSLTPVISEVNNITSTTRGYLKLSPSGEKIAVANQREANDLMLYSFDNETGIIANDGISIFNDSADGEAYGVEFSRTSEKLYVSSTSGFRQNLASAATTYRLFQFDLTAADVEASKVKIHEQIGYRGALQLGPDGKIYATIPLAYDDTNGDATFLDVIENPNAAAADVIFTKDAISLGSQKSTQGLPPFISSLLLPIEIKDTTTDQVINNQNLEFCTGESKTITPENVTGSSVTHEWFFDNGTTTTSVATTPTLTLTNLILNNTGKYSLVVKLTDACGNVTQLEGDFNIEVFEAASATKPDDIIFCDTDNDGLNTFDLQADKTPEILNGQDSNVFEVLYFDSLVAAQNNVAGTALSNSYENPSMFSDQTIYARVHNQSAPNACFAITDFRLAVTGLPVTTQPTPYRICDDTESGDDTDGTINTFVLNTKDSEILGTLSNTQFTVEYYTSLTAAQTDDVNALVDKNINTSVFNFNNQTVFIRVENLDNSDCFDASRTLELIVDPLPVLKATPELDHCVSAGNPNPTVNLTTAQNSISETINASFEFYTDLAGTNQILDPTAYSILVNTTQSVFVKVLSDQNCSREIIELKVNVGQTPDNPYDAIQPAVCDDYLDEFGNDTPGMNSDTDMITNFSLDRNLIIVGINPPVNTQVFFYESINDRANSLSPIDITNYRNDLTKIDITTIANGIQFPIYYKILSTINNNCQGLGQFYVQIITAPSTETVPSLELCDDLNDGNSTNGIVQLFDLESQTPAILGTQSPANYAVSYHLSSVEANSGANPLVSPFTNTIRDTQTIFVRVEGVGCYTAHTSFDLIVNPLPVANIATPIEVCDDNSDGYAIN